ncbi:MAG: hypothetical protein KAG53_06045 [Endozoicomonadaceae bacterium]|nr:hypothetical protein [Endozoicomonadaceae bacterium]
MILISGTKRLPLKFDEDAFALCPCLMTDWRRSLLIWMLPLQSPPTRLDKHHHLALSIDAFPMNKTVALKRNVSPKLTKESRTTTSEWHDPLFFLYCSTHNI